MGDAAGAKCLTGYLTLTKEKRNNHVRYVKPDKNMFLGGIMFGINNKITLVVTSVLCVLLVLEPTSDLTVGIISLPFKAIRMILGFGISVINWPMLVVILISAGVAFMVRTRTVDWAEVKAFFRSEEV